MSRRLALAVAASCLLALLVPCVRSSEVQEKAQKAFDALYGPDVKRALSSRDTTQAVALAAKLLDSAKAAEDQPELMALLCTRACELGAVDPKGYETAQAAADLVASKAPQAAGPCQEVLTTLRQREYDASRGSTKAQAGEALIDALLALAATHTRAGKVEEAGKPLHKASAVAKTIKSSKSETIDAQLKAHAARQKNAAELAKLKRQVEADPANTKARDQLAMLLVVGFDNPAEAAKYLTDASDATLRKFVPAAAKPVSDAPELACLDLLDWYMELGGEASPAGKAAIFTRATLYGKRFLELHTAKDLDRTRVELAMKKAQQEIAKLGGEASSKSQWIDLLRLIDTQRHVVAGKWERTNAGLATDAPTATHWWTEVPLMPSGSYELEVKFVRVSGWDVAVGLPAGSAAVTFVMAGWAGTVSGLETVNGREIDSNETSVKPGRLESGHLYTADIRVQVSQGNVDIKITLDGKPYIKWTGLQKALSPSTPWGVRNSKCVGLGACSAKVVFQSARLRVLSGKAIPA